MINQSDELKVQAIRKRLDPCIKRQDEAAFENGVTKMRDRYGKNLLIAALKDLVENDDWVRSMSLRWLPKDAQTEFINQTFELMASQFIKAGLKIEDNFRVVDQKMALSHAAAKNLIEDGFPSHGEIVGTNNLANIGLSRNPFWHGLAESSMMDTGGKEPEQYFNSWGFASVLISAAMGWIDGEPSETAIENVVLIASMVAPTLDVKRLMERSRYDDSALLRLCGLIQESFDNKVQEAIANDQ